MNRRRFVNLAAATVLAEPFFKSNLLSSLTAKESEPVVYELEGITEEGIKEIFLKLGGIQNFIPGDISKAIVLIKPNLCLPHPSKNGTITSPQAIESLSRVLIGYGVKKIILADHALQKVTESQYSEIAEIIKKYPEITLMLAKEQRFYQPVEVKGKALKSTEILKIIPKADFFINMAAAKHHSATQVSLCIKNLMGAIWNASDFHTKMDLHQAIGDLTLAIKPHLNIIDATRVLLNGGPMGPGQVLTSNKMFASADIVAIDSVVTSRYNFGGKSLVPNEIEHIAAAYQNGAGEMELSKIKAVLIEN